MAYNWVTLSGTLIGPGNTGVSGVVTAIPSNWLTLTNLPAIMAPQGFTTATDANGHWSLSLLSTDSTPVNPPGWFWTLSTRANGVGEAKISFDLPFTAGASQDITQQLPLTTDVVPTTFLNAQSPAQVAAVVNAETARAEAAEVLTAAQMSAANTAIIQLFHLIGTAIDGGSAVTGASPAAFDIDGGNATL